MLVTSNCFTTLRRRRRSDDIIAGLSRCECGDIRAGMSRYESNGVIYLLIILVLDTVIVQFNSRRLNQCNKLFAGYLGDASCHVAAYNVDARPTNRAAIYSGPTVGPESTVKPADGVKPTGDSTEQFKATVEASCCEFLKFD